MPVKISTILYISEYKEKTSSGYLLKTMLFVKPKEGQILSILNSKICKGNNGELDLILTSVSVLNIAPEDLPTYQITAVGIASASNTAIISELGVQVECTISNYISKEKAVEIPVVLFHPSGSRFTNQTMTIQRNSSIFFSGALSLIEDKLYLELQNSSFIRINTSSEKQMPWSLKSTQTSISTSTNTASRHFYKAYCYL
ncbi:hypothetical protein RhiirA1_455095 [Rhizophagus irregularis]|uniref:Uncharacterized protein n=1 Tax=Rhizophagus irregularis TaxID=588596 RepID=A0A2N0S3N4_9GLOM|nr:hypothetical protein RhiirA1_455095 [Rhizophagus irregularis]